MSGAGPSTRAVVRVVAIVVVSGIALYLIYRLRTPLTWIVVGAFIAVTLSAPVGMLQSNRYRPGWVRAPSPWIGARGAAGRSGDHHRRREAAAHEAAQTRLVTDELSEGAPLAVGHEHGHQLVHLDGRGVREREPGAGHGLGGNALEGVVEGLHVDGGCRRIRSGVLVTPWVEARITGSGTGGLLLLPL